MRIVRSSIVLVLCVIALPLLGSCGKSGSSSSAPLAELTSEQEQVARETERGLATLRQDSTALMEDMEQETGPQIERMRNELQAALAEAERVVSALRVDDGRAWEDKLADVDEALRELSRRFAEASLHMRSGGVSLPGIGD